MTAGEFETTADPGDSGPRFAVADWGYDRGLVDAHAAELVLQLAKERRRGDQAERALSQLRLDIHPPPGQGPKGAAARLLAEAGRRVEATILAAEAKAADRLKAAAQQASSLERQARQLLAEAELERARIHAAATRTAERLRAQADREARALIARAREDAELAWQAAVRQRRLLEAEADALATHRQRMVEQLGRLYAPLGLLVVDADESHRAGRGGSGIQRDDPP
jgi:flagellar biosynthesis GTPase FlhF